MLQECPMCGSEVEAHGMDIDWIPSYNDPDSGSTGYPYYIHCKCGVKFEPQIYDWDEFERRWNSIKKRKIKCREYNACNNSCLECDLLLNKKCNIEFDFEIPKKFIRIERRDCTMTWNECPTCRYSIGYHPDIKDFRCERCGQRIILQ